MTQFQLSRYNYFIEDNNNVICYNSLSNKMFILTNTEYKNLNIKLLNLQEFKKSYPTFFNKLNSWGFIIDEGTNEIDIFRFYNKQITYLNQVYMVTINPTLSCNANCWYCITDLNKVEYENQGMTSKTVKEVQLHLANSIKKNKYNEILLDWFGGEPLLLFHKAIKPISEYVFQIAKDYNINIGQHITTNASLIDNEMAIFFNDNNIKSFQIPLDGLEKTHNNIKSIKGINSYEKTIESLSILSQNIKDVSIVLRINYDKHTLKNIDHIISDIPKDVAKNIVVDFQRVVQVRRTEGENIFLKGAIEKFSKEGFKVRSWAFIPSKFIRCSSDRYNQIVINYDGYIYKCTARDYNEKWRIGKLLSDGNIEWNINMLYKYFGKAPFENEMCLNCKHLPLCNGLCVQKAVEISKDKINNFCLYKQSEIEINTYIKYKAHNIFVEN